MQDAINGFDRLLISQSARKQKYGEYVLQLFKQRGLPVEEFPDDEALLKHPKAEMPRTLQALVAPPVGWIKEAEFGMLATRASEHYLNPIIGCRFGCTYCYLLALPHGRRPLRLFVGIEDLLHSIDERLQKIEGAHRPLFCTGELADSLAELDIYPVAAILVEYFSKRKDARLELRTKSDNVEKLLGIDHRQNTTVAFSISPQEHVYKYEPGTASLEQRLVAGRKCQDAGYPVALKIEPLIINQGWQRSYEEAVEAVASRLIVAAIDHVSIGCLRWSEGLAAVPIFAKRHASTIECGTWIEYRDGVINGTVAFSERVAAYDWMRELLRKHGIKAPIWWSLEEPELITEMERRDLQSAK